MALFPSSTRDIPQTSMIPRHIAIIMDGNGRWAKKRFMPRIAGHRRGLESVREAVQHCAELGVEYLTLFAFSSENWRRPTEEVSFLMQLFVHALQQEVAELHKNDIKFKVIGDLTQFDAQLVNLVTNAEALTQNNKRMVVTVAANYGGRQDIVMAVRKMLAQKPELAADFVEQDLEPYLSLNYAPEPDLFIRTGGEKRISNFLLWQLAYTELYFTDVLWPDFNSGELDLAVTSYQKRERRFGRISEQLQAAEETAHVKEMKI